MYTIDYNSFYISKSNYESFKWESMNNGREKHIKSKNNLFLRKNKKYFSHPKENSDEYKRLKEFLWNDFEKYSKYWTIKRTKTAIKLKNIGMEIKPTDRIYMRHRTPKRIEWLKKWKDEHWDTLSYSYSRSREWTVTKELKPKDWDKIKSSYWI